MVLFVSGTKASYKWKVTVLTCNLRPLVPTPLNEKKKSI